MFSSKSFIVSVLTLRSLIHFEFIFEYGVRECSNFILLHVASMKEGSQDLDLNNCQIMGSLRKNVLFAFYLLIF